MNIGNSDRETGLSGGKCSFFPISYIYTYIHIYIYAKFICPPGKMSGYFCTVLLIN